MLCYYSADFSEHYAAGSLATRGFGVLGYGTRYRAMADKFVLEKALNNIAAGTKWLMENTAVKKLIFVGNSGGGSLMAAFQARAEKNPALRGVSRSAGCFGCYVTCPNAVSSRVIHLVFHRYQYNCFSSLDLIKLVY
jgi:hypothetical protein